jgi:hypothetical protein
MIQARWIFIGDKPEFFKEVFIPAFEEVNKKYRIHAYVLDLYKGGLANVIQEEGNSLKNNSTVLIAAEEHKCQALSCLCQNCDPLISSNQVVVDVNGMSQDLKIFIFNMQGVDEKILAYSFSSREQVYRSLSSMPVFFKILIVENFRTKIPGIDPAYVSWPWDLNMIKREQVEINK